MGFDIKDFADILPFILENLPECAFLIIVSIILGFFIGKQVERNMQEKRIVELKSQLSNKEETVTKLNDERDRLQKEMDKLSNKYEVLKTRADSTENGQMNTNYSSLAELERMLNSKEGQIELTALIELNTQTSHS